MLMIIAAVVAAPLNIGKQTDREAAALECIRAEAYDCVATIKGRKVVIKLRKPKMIKPTR